MTVHRPRCNSSHIHISEHRPSSGPSKNRHCTGHAFRGSQPPYKINIAIEGRTCLHHLDKEYLCLFAGKSLLRSEMVYWFYISCPVGWIRRGRIRSSWAPNVFFEGGNFKLMRPSKRMKDDWARHPPSGQSEGLPDRNYVAPWRVTFKPNWWM